MTRSEFIRKAVIYTCLFAYLVLGLRVIYFMLETKEYSKGLMEDFGYYERALEDALQGQDPYSVRLIGPAYLYPPQALLIVEIFHSLGAAGFKFIVYSLLNILLMLWMISRLALYYKLSFRETWYWYLLALGFAPFWETLYMGQINVITLFGIFLFFIQMDGSRFTSGFGLALAILTKVSPVVFLAYAAVFRKYNILIAAFLWVLVISLMAVLRYGLSPLLVYPEAFLWLSRQFPVTYSSLSLASTLIMHSGGIFAGVGPQNIQTALNMYFLALVAASGIMTFFDGRAREPFFIVLALGVAVLPNVMWYHHYVFILLPFLVWMGWSRLDIRVVVWCLVCFILIHADRISLTYGLLMQIAVHVSILILLGLQAARLRNRTITTGPALTG